MARAIIGDDQNRKAQLIRDLPIWQRRCWLHYAPRRFKCVTCQDTFVERVLWRQPDLDYTSRYEQSLYQRACREPISHIAESEQLSEDIVQGIFERGAKKTRRPRLPTREGTWSGLHYYGICKKLSLGS